MSELTIKFDNHEMKFIDAGTGGYFKDGGIMMPIRAVIPDIINSSIIHINSDNLASLDCCGADVDCIYNWMQIHHPNEYLMKEIISYRK